MITITIRSSTTASGQAGTRASASAAPSRPPPARPGRTRCRSPPGSPSRRGCPCPVGSVHRDVDRARARPRRVTAATTGTAASAGRRSEPTRSSRLSSRPARKKKIASAPSAAQCSRSSGPTVEVADACRTPPARFAQTRASAAAASAIPPPTVSERSSAPTKVDSPGSRVGKSLRRLRCLAHGRLRRAWSVGSPTRLPGTPAPDLTGQGRLRRCGTIGVGGEYSFATVSSSRAPPSRAGAPGPPACGQLDCRGRKRPPDRAHACSRSRLTSGGSPQCMSHRSSGG